MKKKKFKIRVKAETISTKFTDIEVESTATGKARGVAEYQADVLEAEMEWTKPTEKTTVISSEFLEIIDERNP